MKVGIIQSNYIPWRGYFDFIDSVDLFVFHDDLQYTKNDWRNRNKIKTRTGLSWLTVPVKYNRTAQLISETEIDYTQKWGQKHINMLKENYQKSPYFKDISEPFFEIISKRHNYISELNIEIIKFIMQELSIKTPLKMSCELALTGAKTARVIDILKKNGATTYLSGPAAKNYLDENMFKENHISLEYKSYDYPEYPQLWGSFEGAVSVLDLLFNTGTEARKFLKSKTPDVVALK